LELREREAQLASLYVDHRRRALALARRILRDADAAEDVVQELFTRLWLHDGRTPSPAVSAAWLRRVVLNACINAMRSQRRRRRLELEPSAPIDPERAAMGSELLRDFEHGLTQVTPSQRQMLWLRELRGFSYPEIASLLGVPEGTVKSTLNRGRLRLQEVLAATG
jgi:RNA polymerase sigma-70 factor (ECF subfamily)